VVGEWKLLNSHIPKSQSPLPVPSHPSFFCGLWKHCFDQYAASASGSFLWRGTIVPGQFFSNESLGIFGDAGPKWGFRTKLYFSPASVRPPITTPSRVYNQHQWEGSNRTASKSRPATSKHGLMVRTINPDVLMAGLKPRRAPKFPLAGRPDSLQPRAARPFLGRLSAGLAVCFLCPVKTQA